MHAQFSRFYQDSPSLIYHRGKRNLTTDWEIGVFIPFACLYNQVVVFSPLLSLISNTILLRSLLVTNEVQTLISVPDSKLDLQVPAILQERGGGKG